MDRGITFNHQVYRGYSMRDLKYKFVNAQDYITNYQNHYPHAPSNQDESEFLICGEGEYNEQKMNAYKVENWPQPEEDKIEWMP
jgi:hypothetical protein